MRLLLIQEDIVNAMALTGQVLMGQSVMVKSSEVSCLYFQVAQNHCLGISSAG